jgi:hypothetical protein
LKKSSKGVPLKKSFPKLSPGEIVTVLSERMDTTEGRTFFDTSTKAKPRSLAVLIGAEVLGAALQPETGTITVRIVAKNRKDSLR